MFLSQNTQLNSTRMSLQLHRRNFRNGRDTIGNALQSIMETFRYSLEILTSLVWFGLVWFDLFVHPFSHTCNIGHVNYKLQFIYYNTNYNIRTSTQYNIISKGKVFFFRYRPGLAQRVGRDVALLFHDRGTGRG